MSLCFICKQSMVNREERSRLTSHLKLAFRFQYLLEALVAVVGLRVACVDTLGFNASKLCNRYRCLPISIALGISCMYTKFHSTGVIAITILSNDRDTLLKIA